VVEVAWVEFKEVEGRHRPYCRHVKDLNLVLGIAVAEDEMENVGLSDSMLIPVAEAATTLIG
jgi:hypothetical protein